MKTTFLQQRQLDEAKALWRMCFPEDSEAFIAQYFDARIDMGNAMGVAEAGRLCAILHMVPYTLRIRGKDVFAPYVVGAGTDTGHRRRGLMGGLLVDALGEMRARGAGVSPLYPFRYGYYRRFGWEAVSARALLSLDAPVAASALARYDGDICTPDAAQMQKIYRQFCARFGAYMLRDERECALRLAEALLEGGAVMLEDGSAYALYGRRNGELVVQELCYTHVSAMRALLRHLAAKQGVERLRVPLPVSDALMEELHDVKGCVSLEPFLMLRVVDVVSLLEGMDALSGDGTLLLGVSDGQLAWNNAVFAVETHRGRIVHVEKTRHAPQAEIAASALGQWVCGYITAQAALRDGLIRAGAAAADMLCACDTVQSVYFQELY